MLVVDVRDGVAWLKFDRAEKLNAMARSFWRELTSAMDDIAAATDVRVAVFHGAGRCFSVGGDIEDFQTIGDTVDRRAYMREALGAFQAVEQMPKPTLAAVHGHVAGGGCELTMVCDLVVADETARFSTPEAAIGLVPGLGLVRGRAHANLHWMKYMVMTGEPLSAAEAQQVGLVNRVVPEGEHLAEAERLARVMAARSPLALSVGKQMLNRGSCEGYDYAVEAIALLQGAQDFSEGLAAFTERRPASFTRS